MRYRVLNNTVLITRTYMEKHIKEGHIVLDATIGNGNDTVLMAKMVSNNGQVYGFDIQELALKNTKDALMQKKLIHRVKLIKDNHANIDKYIHCKLDFIVYNLGYLPNGDKNIITKVDSTIKSVKKSLNLLNGNGLILINSYTGHAGGNEENKQVEDLLRELNQKYFNILKYDFINQKKSPPVLYVIEKSL